MSENTTTTEGTEPTAPVAPVAAPVKPGVSELDGYSIVKGVEALIEETVPKGTPVLHTALCKKGDASIGKEGYGRVEHPVKFLATQVKRQTERDKNGEKREFFFCNCVIVKNSVLARQEAAAAAAKVKAQAKKTPAKKAAPVKKAAAKVNTPTGPGKVAKSAPAKPAAKKSA